MGPSVAPAGNTRMKPEVDGQILSRDRRALEKKKFVVFFINNNDDVV